MKDDYLNRYDRMQRINKYKEPTDREIHMLGIFVAIAATALIAAIYSMSVPQENYVALKCGACHFETHHTKMTRYFAANGSPVPAKMASAVMMTPRPKLMAAVAVVESGGDPTARRKGFKKRHDGAFQVNPSFHGAVPTDPIKQAQQAEAILDELIGKHGLNKGLAKYGGDSTDKYSRMVLAELQEVP